MNPKPWITCIYSLTVSNPLFEVPPMQRREFLTWVGVGSLASSLPIVLAACTDSTAATKPSPKPSPKPSETPTKPGAKPSATPSISARKDGFTIVGTVAALTKDGVIKVAPTAIPGAKPMVVVPQGKTVAAIETTCSHRGCTLEWNKTDKALVCPCHGAKFGADGKGIAGPSGTPIKTYSAKIEGQSVLVKAI
jgi:cytochrome b6-f complex iron-sulfur subunit